MIGLYFSFVCCLDGAAFTGCFWWSGHAGSCIQVVSFVYLILPRVISLVVLGLGVCVPTPKAQSLISAQEQRFHKLRLLLLLH